MAGLCECGDEPLGCLKCGEFVDWLCGRLAFKSDSAPCSSFRKPIADEGAVLSTSGTAER